MDDADAGRMNLLKELDIIDEIPSLFGVEDSIVNLKISKKATGVSPASDDDVDPKMGESLD